MNLKISPAPMIAINNTTKQSINSRKIQDLAGKFWRAYKLANKEVSLALVGPTAMRRLNKKYRGIDKATDVLSFPEPPLKGTKVVARCTKVIVKNAKAAKNSHFASGRGPAFYPENTKYFGEIIINLAETKKLAKYREMFEELGMKEFAALSRRSDLSLKKRRVIEDYLFYFLLVHGLLHLLGYDDQNEKDRREMLKIGRDFLAHNLP